MRKTIIVMLAVLCGTAACCAKTVEGEVRGITRSGVPIGIGTVEVGDYFFLKQDTVYEGWPEYGQVEAGQRVCAVFTAGQGRNNVSRLHLLSMGDGTVGDKGCEGETLTEGESVREGVVCVAKRGQEGIVAGLMIGWSFVVKDDTAFKGVGSFEELKLESKVSIDYTVMGARNIAKVVKVNL